jgi:hypothetical protein
VPGIGSHGGKYQLSVGWRVAEANKSYFDSRVNKDFTRLWNPHEKLSIMDVTAGYAINRRTSIQASLPIVFNDFSMLYPPKGPNEGTNKSTSVRGVGDLSIFSQTWLLDGKKSPRHNVALGVGLKFPTGNWRYQSLLPDETGKNFKDRTAYPPAILPGDGGLGVLVGYQAYKTFLQPRWLTNFSVFTSGNYLINPRNQNGAPSMVSSLGVPLTPNFANVLTNSVPDTYNLQAGINWRPPGVWDKPKLKGLRFRCTYNLEGLAARDLIGGNDGFRQSGYAMSVGPGLVWVKGRDIFLFDVPIVFNQHINPSQSLLPGPPGPPINGIPQPSPVNFRRQMGLVAPVSLSMRYIRTF